MKARLPGLLLIAVACLYGWQALQIPVFAADAREVMTARTLPLALAGALIIVGGLLLVPGQTAPTMASTLSGDRRRWWQAIGLLLVSTLFGLSVEALGVLPAATVALFASLLVLGVRQLRVLVLVPLLVSGVLWVLLVLLLGLHLHPGDWWRGDV